LQESEIGMDESKGYYFAEATALTANLLLPLKRDIEPQAFAQLPAEGGYKAQQVQAFKLQAIARRSRAAGTPLW
jgi:hypothetical protein